MYLFSRWRRKSDPIDNTMTKTGETFGERKAYHQRGELSPGEHALARAIRENLVRQGWIAGDAETPEGEMNTPESK